MTKRPLFGALGFLLAAVLIVEIALAIWLPIREKNNEEITPIKEAKRTSQYSGFFKNGAVAADVGACSTMGKDVLEMGGNAVDATITTVLCNGVTQMQSGGIGGGSFFMLYDKEKSISKFLNCRETAPRSAHRDMFENSIDDSLKGGRSILIPGEIKCYSEAHSKYGKLDWNMLVEPVIKIIREGVFITKEMDYWFNEEGYVEDLPMQGHAEIFYNPDGRPKQAGDKIINEPLAKTFEKIAKDKHYFYSDEMAKIIVDEVNSFGGDFVLEDITDYELEEVDALTFEIGDFIGHVAPPPSSGPVLAFILNIINHLKLKGQLNKDVQSAEFHHKFIEAFKFGFGKRSLLGDPKFQPDPEDFAELISNLTSPEYAKRFADKITDHTLEFEEYEPAFEVVEDAGTAQISIMDSSGMATSVTSTINTILGSGIVGPTSGIIYNNEMNDFSMPGYNNHYGVPPSPQNYIAPGKRPLSSMTPAIFTSKKSGWPVLALGGSGGTRITTSTATVVAKVLLMNKDLNDAIQESRLHHQLMPLTIRQERRFNEKILDELKGMGHELGKPMNQNGVVQAVQNLGDDFYAVCDSRKEGFPDGF